MTVWVVYEKIWFKWGVFVNLFLDLRDNFGFL